ASSGNPNGNATPPTRRECTVAARRAGPPMLIAPIITRYGLLDIFVRPSFQISHARRAGEPSFVINWAMWSVNMIGELQDIKGVALWMTGSAFFLLRSIDAQTLRM